MGGGGGGGGSFERKKKKKNWVGGGEKIKFPKKKLGRGQGENKVAKKI